MTLILEQDPNWSYILKPSYPCVQLVEWIEKRGYPLEVTLSRVPCAFHLTGYEIEAMKFNDGLGVEYRGKDGSYNSLQECLGYTGYQPSRGSEDNRPSCPLIEQVVSISGVVRSNQYTMSNEFIPLKGAGTHSLWHPLFFREKPILEHKRKGWYKRSGFDVAYAAMKALIPSISEEDFACTSYDEVQGYFNPLLVDFLDYRGEEGCLQSFELNEKIGIKGYMFFIKSLDSDLDRNLGAIKELLSEMEGDYLSLD